jgi:hypothetical protein
MPTDYGLYFHTALYGSPNLKKGADGTYGYQKRFGPNGEFLGFAAELLSATSNSFRQRVAQNFAERHGRTGTTAQSITEKGRWVNRSPGSATVTGADYRFVYTIEIAGNVGYVINPIASHLLPGGGNSAIAARGTPMGNFMDGPFEGRTTNFYSPFGPRYAVYWYQGGSESFSPDKSWYMDDQTLITDMATGMASLAARAALIWGDSATSFTELPLKMPANNSISFGP